MNKHLSLFAISLMAALLISWGYTGHRTVAVIAERHLTPQAKAAVHDLLSGESLADVANWADEVSDDSAYKQTASWHFANVPLGLNFNEFYLRVAYQFPWNVYTKMNYCEGQLQSDYVSSERKVEALKFLVHFVGDAHQPMHISRKEDKGGNTIQVQLDGRGTNLHTLWDSRLLDKEGLTDAQLADKLDQASPEQVKKWQSGDPVQWIWESYRISSKLYAEVEQNNKLGEAYYQSHIGIVNERLEMGGIRLAGILNRIFKEYKPSVSSMLANREQSLDITVASAAARVDLTAIKEHVGETVTIEGKVFDHKDFGSMVMLNVGAAYPKQLLTVVLKGKARKKYLAYEKLNAQLKSPVDDAIAVKGKLVLYKDKPEIELTDPDSFNMSIAVRHQ